MDEAIVDQYALISPGDIVDYDAQAADVSSTVLDAICRSITVDIEEYTKRRIRQRTYTAERYDGTGSVYLRLRNPPLATLTTVQWKTETPIVIADEIAIASQKSDGEQDEHSTVLYRSAGWGPRPLWRQSPRIGFRDASWASPNVPLSGDIGDSSAAWKITHTSGFADVPGDLKLICLEMAQQLVRKNIKGDIASETIGSYSYSLFGGTLQTKESEGPNARWRHVLARYRQGRVR